MMSPIELPPEIAGVILTRDGLGKLLVFCDGELVQMDFGPRDLASLACALALKVLNKTEAPADLPKPKDELGVDAAS
jgi:hypothetical protein